MFYGIITPNSEKELILLDNKKSRGQWGSNIGFLLAAIGSAVGLGNIWGFPYKMGKCGGFTFLIIYLLLAVFVGFTIMVSELAIGRKTRLNAVGAYNTTKKGWGWVGWLAVLSPFLIMTFYTVLGGYCMQYMALNIAELFNLREALGIPLGGGDVFSAMLTSPWICILFTVLYIAVNFLIVRGGISGGIEKFNKVGMPALFVMLCIIIVRALTLDGAVEGLKFMFVPGYAVSAGFIEKAPSFVTVLATAGGQMFFSLSLAMGIMVTYGSYLGKSENLAKNSIVIVFSDTLVALMAGLAVIPAAVANAVQNGIPFAQVKLGGPSLLFVTLQDVFAGMGKLGAVFGIIFYLLVFVAAMSSSISLTEVITTFFIDNVSRKKGNANRSKVTFWVCIAILVLAVLVAADGLGSNGFSPWNVFGMEKATADWNADWLDFMDCWSEGIAMPIGALATSILVGWVIKPKAIFEECEQEGNRFPVKTFFAIAIKFVVPIAMILILLGQLDTFFALGLFK